MQSNFDSEIRKISKALIIFSTKTNLFLIELIFRWPIIVFKASILCLRIRRMSLFIEKHDSEFSEEKKLWPVVNRLCLFCSQTELKLFKKFLKCLTKADMPWSFRCKLLLFKGPLTLILLWQIKCIFSSVHVTFKRLLLLLIFFCRNHHADRYLKQQLQCREPNLDIDSSQTRNGNLWFPSVSRKVFCLIWKESKVSVSLMFKHTWKCSLYLRSSQAYNL